MSKETETKEDEKLVPVGDGVETSVEEESKVQSPTNDDDEDEKVGHAEEGSDEDKDEDEDPRERLRAKRRREKQRRRERIAGERQEINFLRERNEALERQFSQLVIRQEKSENVSIDQRINDLEGKIREAEAIHSQAVDAKDGSTATEALRVSAALRETLGKMRDDREDRVKAREQETVKAREQKTAPPVNQEAILNGREWLRRNEWFDTNLRDDDSYMVRALEERMAREGQLNPADPEYWEELDRRISKKLPHLKKNEKGTVTDESDDDTDLDWEDDDERPAKKPARKPSGPRIAVGGKTRTLRPNEVHLSAQRVEALKQAGVWEDDARREKYLRAYKKYDDEARKNR